MKRGGILYSSLIFFIRLFFLITVLTTHIEHFLPSYFMLLCFRLLYFFTLLHYTVKKHLDILAMFFLFSVFFVFFFLNIGILDFLITTLYSGTSGKTRKSYECRALVKQNKKVIQSYFKKHLKRSQISKQTSFGELWYFEK